MVSSEDQGKREVTGAANNSIAVRKVGVKRPAVDIACIGHGFYYHLIADVNGVGSRPQKEREEGDLVEAMRSALHVAITKVLSDYSRIGWSAR